MIICDRCKNLDAKTLNVHISYCAIPKFDGSSEEKHLDLCRNCFDDFRKFFTGIEYNIKRDFDVKQQ